MIKYLKPCTNWLTYIPAIAGLALFGAPPALASTPEKQVPGVDFGIQKDEPIMLVADELGYDTANKKVIAKGNVEISQNLTVLLAKEVEYDETTEIVIARGDVSVMESTGNVYFAEEVMLKDEMQRGTIAYFKGRLSDGSLFTAHSAEKVSDAVTKLKKAVYTPCALFCAADGSPKRPTWAITASDVEIDTDKQEVNYDNVWVEVYGQPLIYTPILSHPTPGADNKSGFLSPALQQDENLGIVAEIPYYYVFNQSQDITIQPMFTSKEGPVMKGEYRQRFERGDMKIKGSITVPRDRDASGSIESGRQFRGHVDGEGVYDIDPSWQTGFRLNRTTDDTYLTRYNIKRNESLLTSRAYVEGINPLQNGNDRHYLLSQGLYFQGLTAQDDRRRIPIVLPLLEYGYTTKPMWAGSRLSVDGNMMILTRENGTDSRRISGRVNWNLPYTTTGGHIFELDTSLGADGYDIADQQLTNGLRYDGQRARFAPQISATWRYPLINRFESSNLMIEPIANITASPLGLNDEEIPNEDNVLPEFNDLNLFSSRRFSGWDRLETGTRLYYGLRSMWGFAENRYLSGTLGQVYRFNNDPLFPLTNDLRSRFSDYVGQIRAAYQPFSFAYRFRLDRDNFETQRQEIDTGLNFNRFGVNANYLELNNDPFLGNNQEITLNSYVRLNNYWTLSGSVRRDLELDRLTNGGVGLSFSNECTTLIFGVNRDLTNDRDIRESTSAYVQLLLKNLE